MNMCILQFLHLDEYRAAEQNSRELYVYVVTYMYMYAYFHELIYIYTSYNVDYICHQFCYFDY